MKRAGLVLTLAMGATLAIAGGPSGLNIIPTTDIVPFNNWIGSFQNGNTNLTGLPFYRRPVFLTQTQFGIDNMFEAGIDHAQTADIDGNQLVFNAKALLLNEDDLLPNIAAGIMNVTQGQAPSYYITISKTLNYSQQQEQRFRAHHRRNRKLLGRRVHFGFMTDGHGLTQPFLGTDLQLSESAVFQADWVSGAGNQMSAGFSFVLRDARTVLNPALIFSNDSHALTGFQFNISHQFNF